jgi:hypothetical protein
MAPWRDRRVANADTSHGGLGWLMLNADTLFLALLAAAAGLFDLADPTRDDVTAHVGVVSPLFYLRVGAYVLAGLMLIYALTRSRIRPEVWARAVLFGATVLDAYRHGVVFGWADSHTGAAYVLVVIVAVTSLLRLKMLLNPGGLMVTRVSTQGGPH